MVDVKQKQLRGRLAELEGRLHRIEDHLEQLPDQGWEDNAIESEMDQVLEGLGHAGNAEIQAIYAALARLKGGIYGVCARCGDDIVLTFTAYTLVPDLCAQGRAEELEQNFHGCNSPFSIGPHSVQAKTYY